MAVALYWQFNMARAYHYSFFGSPTVGYEVAGKYHVDMAPFWSLVGDLHLTSYITASLFSVVGGVPFIFL